MTESGGADGVHDCPMCREKCGPNERHRTVGRVTSYRCEACGWDFAAESVVATALGDDVLDYLAAAGYEVPASIVDEAKALLASDGSAMTVPECAQIVLSILLHGIEAVRAGARVPWEPGGLDGY